MGHPHALHKELAVERHHVAEHVLTHLCECQPRRLRTHGRALDEERAVRCAARREARGGRQWVGDEPASTHLGERTSDEPSGRRPVHTEASRDEHTRGWGRRRRTRCRSTHESAARRRRRRRRRRGHRCHRSPDGRSCSRGEQQPERKLDRLEESRLSDRVEAAGEIRRREAQQRVRCQVTALRDEVAPAHMHLRQAQQGGGERTGQPASQRAQQRQQVRERRVHWLMEGTASRERGRAVGLPGVLAPALGQTHRTTQVMDCTEVAPPLR